MIHLIGKFMYMKGISAILGNNVSKDKEVKNVKNKGIAHIRLEIRVTVEVVLIILHHYYRKLWVTIYTEVDILVLCTYFRMLICHAHFCTQSLSMLSNSNLF